MGKSRSNRSKVFKSSSMSRKKSKQTPYETPVALPSDTPFGLPESKFRLNTPVIAARRAKKAESAARKEARRQIKAERASYRPKKSASLYNPAAEEARHKVMAINLRNKKVDDVGDLLSGMALGKSKKLKHHKRRKGTRKK